jgi:aminopeptidase N
MVKKDFLDCSYYVFKDNLAKAKEQFKDVPRMLQAFEHWFGPYPFMKIANQSKLLLGMEHKALVTW